MPVENPTLRAELQLLAPQKERKPENNKSGGSQSKRLRVEIPHDLNLDRIYNPKYSVLQLMSTRRRPRPSSNPPRPPNAYFLLKNCYMLELRALGYRYTMPELCIQSKRVWRECPQEVKDRYDKIQLQVQCIHNEMYPGYKFRPKKRNTFKMHVFPNKMNENVSSFSTTNYLNANHPPLENYLSSEPGFSSAASEGSNLETNSPVISETFQPTLSSSDPTLVQINYDNAEENHRQILTSGYQQEDEFVQYNATDCLFYSFYLGESYDFFGISYDGTYVNSADSLDYYPHHSLEN
ncbi:11195_t:CDS:1 [Acaulospora colombiana]|uniref:11195_t:CDS:1 n=1 Tax=Acaulospora colombiana TaxID=27376 RepID=A0ACA9M0F2_9GLOM|nr:11195_t:CDS:1 [Acaulospora colombiana]